MIEVFENYKDSFIKRLQKSVNEIVNKDDDVFGRPENGYNDILDHDEFLDAL